MSIFLVIILLLSFVNIIPSNAATASLSLNKNTYKPGEQIIVNIKNIPSRYAWVGIYNSNVSSYPGNSLGMWVYATSGNQDITYPDLSDRSVKLTAEIHDIDTNTYHALPNGSYKVVLFKDNGYIPLATVSFRVGGTSVSAQKSDDGYLYITYKGAMRRDAWIGIYDMNVTTYGKSNPSKEWAYVNIDDNFKAVENGTVKIRPDKLNVGKTYKVVFFPDEGYTPVATSSFYNKSTATIKSNEDIKTDTGEVFLYDDTEPESRYGLFNTNTGEVLKYDDNINTDNFKQKVKTALRNVNEVMISEEEFDANVDFSDASINSLDNKYQNKYLEPTMGLCYIITSVTDKNNPSVSGTYKSTGFFISENAIATAAHCILGTKIDGINDSRNYEISIRVFYTYIDEDGVKKFAYQDTPLFAVPEKWTPNDYDMRRRYDYGVIYINNYSTESKSLFKMNTFSSVPNYNIKTYTTIGFRGSINDTPYNMFNKYLNMEVFIGSGKILQSDIYNKYSVFDFNINDGQSGSPIFYINDKMQYEVIAIVNAKKTEGESESQCHAKIISNEAMSFFKVNAFIHNNDENDYMNIIHVDKYNHFSAENINITILEDKGDKNCWIGLYRNDVKDYENNSLGMWKYIKNNSQNQPAYSVSESMYKVLLTAQMHDISTNSYHALPQGKYKIVLFSTNGYTPIAQKEINVGGEILKINSVSTKSIELTYDNVVRTDAWIGIYPENVKDYPNNPSLAWSYVDRNKDSSTITINVGLTSGERYKAVLFADSGYTKLVQRYFICP